MSTKSHWQDVYERKRAEEVSWFKPHLDISLSFIRASGLARDARIVDIGGGASTLVDDLQREGYSNLAVVDLAEAALQTARARLGERADEVDWLCGDATTPLLPSSSVDFWHDRAVFHFLVDDEARDSYLEQVRSAVVPGGRVLVATFGLDGPDKCSGLPTRRYAPAEIKEVFGDSFVKLGQATERHQTPWGSEQAFVYCLCMRSSASVIPPAIRPPE